MASRQLCWLSKIALIEETCLPRKFIGAWHANSHPVGRPQQTICHMYLCELHMMRKIPMDDMEGIFAMWFPQATIDPKEWERHRKLLTPNLIDQKYSTKDQTRINKTGGIEMDSS
eukprot:7754207-Ditylum_brightwellii.AAC.1